MNKFQSFAKNLLLAFVLISVGFALGKEATVRRTGGGAGAAAPVTATAADQVVLSYLHTTFRCVTCNEIERLARELVETEFAEELASGRIAWREANFQQEPALAKRYEVVSSCVVVANFKGGEESGYQRLDEVWTMYQSPADFNLYVGTAIRQYLDAAEAP
jgi:hypothetical protein